MSDSHINCPQGKGVNFTSFNPCANKRDRADGGGRAGEEKDQAVGTGAKSSGFAPLPHNAQMRSPKVPLPMQRRK